jgi:hypothetical protein
VLHLRWGIFQWTSVAHISWFRALLRW